MTGVGSLGLALGLLLAAPTGTLAQTAERLYEAGAWRIAADSFAERAGSAPGVTAHWYNMGAAAYRAGDDVLARAAWVNAARLEPRSSLIGTARGLLSGTDPLTSELLRVAPLTPAEGTALAAVLWTAGWLLVGIRRVRLALAPLALALGAAGFTTRTSDRYDQSVALVRRPATPIRQAPYRTAPSRRIVDEGTAVRVTRLDGSWLLVERGAERGWLLDSEVQPVTPLPSP